MLALAYWDGLTGEQVAIVLGVTPASARKRLQRARERLQRARERLRRVLDAEVRHGSQRGERALTGQ